MRVRLLLGPRKGQVLEMSSAQARRSVEARLGEFVPAADVRPVVEPEIEGNRPTTLQPSFLRRRSSGG